MGWVVSAPASICRLSPFALRRIWLNWGRFNVAERPRDWAPAVDPPEAPAKADSGMSGNATLLTLIA
jgi:hypothetical protein